MPRTEDEDQGGRGEKEAEGEEEEKEEGIHRGSLVEEGPATDNWIGEQPSEHSRMAGDVTRSSRLVSLLSCCQHLTDTVHGHRLRSESPMHAENQASGSCSRV